MATWVNLLDVIFPVGSFYISRQATSPASIVGGSWTQVTNAVLRGSTSIGYIGSDTHALTSKELPREYEVWIPNTRISNIGSSVAVDGAINQGNLWGIHSQWLGGGKHIQLCNAPTIALFGIAQPKECDVKWPNCILKMEVVGLILPTIYTLWGHSISALKILVQRLHLEELGALFRQGHFYAEQGADILHCLQAVNHQLHLVLVKCRLTLTPLDNWCFRFLNRHFRGSLISKKLRTITGKILTYKAQGKDSLTKIDRLISQSICGEGQHRILGLVM